MYNPGEKYCYWHDRYENSSPFNGFLMTELNTHTPICIYDGQLDVNANNAVALD